MSTHVRLENPETGGVWDSPIDYAPIARARGWVDSDKALAEEEVDTTKDPATPVADVPAGFNPDEHTVAEVKEYLDALPAYKTDERDRVVELERAGKNRSTVTGE